MAKWEAQPLFVRLEVISYDKGVKYRERWGDDWWRPDDK
ncbi:hypothetical protein SCAR479_02470 [Seiridium cardinale]|uniref:Uncharacterized protein n=1 Tax=Seiridium cardinale TaxID=138064 RepID=A0ABR2X6J1_9PEZI